MEKRNLIEEFVEDERISDETLYTLYQFLQELVLEFESKAFSRLRNVIDENEIRLPAILDDDSI